MTPIHLLSGLREDGVTFSPEPGNVIRLTLPQGQRLYGLAEPGRPWSAGLYGLVEEFHHYRELLIECARISPFEAQEMSWAMLIAGYTTPGN